ncbi:MAG: carbohydrate-binding domain-containing protein [Clostridiales bacterium]|nr:carbohydrate-binding domain-containing protein [Clostridiales bacterium]
MKVKKSFLLVLIALVVSLMFALVGCGTNNRPDGGKFINPGDSLGGGGTGEIAGEADDTSNGSTKDDMQGQVGDLDDLSGNTSSDGATVVQPTNDIYEISKTGSYYFSGEYGGILITKKDIDVHVIFDNATFVNDNGIAVDGSDKKPKSVIITLKEGSTNHVENSGDDVNAIHVKAPLSINGKGILNVKSNSKSAIKSSKEIRIVDATINATAANHGITGLSVTAANCTIDVKSAGKDGINAECDDATAEFTTAEGFVALSNVNYTCDVDGDGIQADTVIYIDGGSYNIKTNGKFVQKTADNMTAYDLAADDFKYTKSGNDYKRIASDEANRYSSSQLYALTQSCKGIKVGEIEYSFKDDDGNKVEGTVYDGDYLIAISDGTFNIDCTDDAIHASSGNVLIEGGTCAISTYDDAITSDHLTKITGGDITIETSYEGIEGAYVEISGGTVDVTATDDGINAASDDKTITAHIIISGGDVKVNSGGDGIDSNGSILISGGTVLVYGPTSGMDAGLDADKGIVITGGKVFATSTLGMVETPSTNSTQYVVSYAYQSKITAGSVITLCDSSNNTLLSVEIVKECQSIIFSTPELKNGGTYTLYGGSTKLTSFTVSSIITTIGSSGGSFPGGNGPGGNKPGGGFGPGGR